MMGGLGRISQATSGASGDCCGGRSRLRSKWLRVVGMGTRWYRAPGKSAVLALATIRSELESLNERWLSL